MLAGDKLGIGFGGRTLFSDLSFTVRPGDRVALAGPNGAGKSTLLKILTKNEMPDSGRVVQAKTVEVGYLPQEGVKHEGKTLYAEAETAFQAVLKLQGDCDALGEKLGELDTSSEEYLAVLEQFGDLQLRLENHDLSRMRPKIETVLSGLGFKHSDLERDTGEFSGGWQMRIALSKHLLAEPDVLLLDEPTNHLDMDSVTWLEGYLKNYAGAIVLISHDRHLLDAITTRTLAFENGRVESYSGNYSFYLTERIARREQLERSYRNQQKEIAKAEALIDRFRAKASKAKMAQSRIKQLDKMERIEIEGMDSEVSFRFPPAPSSGQKVIELEGLTKSYGEGEPVLKDLDFILEKGERIAVVGVNGAGKSTFSRILAGVEPFDSGTREVGFKVEIAYFSQDHAEDLDRNMTVYECAADAALRGVTESEIRGVLGCFLFRSDDVFKKVSVLSGGERSRLALARLLLSPSNFLILDEPTNHLDLASQAVLREALSGYTGSYAIVSHNRDFLDPIVEKVIEFIPDSPPKVYLGNVTDYVDKKKADEKAKNAAAGASSSGVSSSSTPAPSSGGGNRNRKKLRKEEARLRQERQATLKPLQDKLEVVEGQIAVCEKAKADLVAEMSQPENAADGEKMKELGVKFQKANVELEKSYSAWSEVSEELERVEAKLGA